ncbi:MAG: hypothetical protein A2725_01855 [Candidatus Magasanikbacteria bacterium RIFCSPHIGHO2_01_FULL_33_34]|uniref:Glycosyltransferase 2-like domain-containing protein n=1 Tax=Candidatus Magasanikbacteria bacterium RIFCSPHIGHO2_01_FULL_33_34 TaxID=1798671 RepID=A0A1F6LKM4_9BACT|nr:MAG: hypothetical protein A2725_01855 [Candidatus Magasanikbacteria bacterium RIFCSPHIGHO2_01_FULL_33_34]OGH65716.1 MAG: hypothetical protein A3B83_02360 [Candidatus Magasanikbacteria bacterium RIFCSPHIGHO2_02_FULL_33_17]OGH76329.1 MAG: hypothetical protein A3A89_03185 [Candidatus Magasanikbacteria bacterium RIFCSPLOWO2_01_FULL_33_34]OGH82474.1 MAG: hypothetical protein A3F93_03730 [Candidatus Magasanikbacteria bacterium RIFCSPLOWO2_12_FULL_34_7]
MKIAIIPAYNEEKSLGSVVRSLLNHVDRVVVVDDGSKDKTAKVAFEEGAVVLRHKINRGQGAALQTGHEYARLHKVDYVLHFDGDGQFDAIDIVPAFEKIQSEQADILFGSRFLGKESNIPFIKKNLIFPIARVFNRWMTGIKLSDIHNGFRILNKRAFTEINIKQDRMAHATEIINQTRLNNLKFVEFPVKVMYREYGQGFSGGIKIISDLFTSKFVSK